MMEIKFRAMTKPPEDFGNYHFESVMVYGTGFLKDPVNTWLVSSKENEPIAFGTVEKIIMPETVGQFTGLHDKNGKEIYDGDICRIKFDIAKVEDYIYNSLTKKELETGERIFIVESPLFNNQQELNVDDIEVIGNIHENPELVK